ncbi:MAG: glutathione S-transferase family protein [Sphingorhabdus sp.]
MKIFGASLSPFVRKLMVYCAERGIEYDHTPTFPMGPDGADPDFVAASPMGKIPAMNDDGFTLADSSAIIHYLEVKHGAALLPEEAKARGKAVFYDEVGDTVIPAVMGPIFINRVVMPKFMGKDGDSAAADKAEKEDMPPLLAKLEAMMPEAGGFLVEGRLTLADIAVASPFVNLKHAGVAPDAAQHPRLAKWLAGIWSLPSFSAQIASEEKFLAG